MKDDCTAPLWFAFALIFLFGGLAFWVTTFLILSAFAFGMAIVTALWRDHKTNVRVTRGR